MKTIELKYRMIGLVPYNLSPIQQGIQFAHAVQEYNNKVLLGVYNNGAEPQDFEKWRSKDKTFIILNGGTTNNFQNTGTLNQHMITLDTERIEYAIFEEPDLGDQLTAIVFLVDERVWDKELYPDRFLEEGPKTNKDGFVVDIYYAPETEESFERRLGGKKNVFLREFLKQFKLA